MRKGVSGVRRLAAILSVTTVAFLVTGTGVGQAVTLPKLANYSAVGTGQVLGLKIQLPALAPVLQAAKLPATIEEQISFSRSIGQVDRAGNIGNGLGQMFHGSLDGVLETVVNAVPQSISHRTKTGLPRVFAQLGELAQTDSILSINVPDAAPIVHLGVAEVNAVSKLQNLAGGLKGIASHSDSKLVGLKVTLPDVLTGPLKTVLQPVLDLTDGADGLINKINTGLDTVEQTIKDSPLGLDVNLDLPQLEQLLSQPLITVGLIETGSDTGFAGLARTAKGITRMANIDVMGVGENALVHIDSLSTDTNVSIDGTQGGAVANAVNRIVGLKVLGNSIDLTKGALKINNTLFSLPVDSVLEPLTKLLTDTLGLKIDLLSAKHSASATHAFAEANTLKISLAPLNGALGLIELTGPGSMAEVQGSPVEAFTPRAPLPTTGVPTTTMFVAGAALLGMTVLIRRFALSR
jgi:hypothetical protein